MPAWLPAWGGSKTTDASLGGAKTTDASLGNSVDKTTGVSDVSLRERNNQSIDASLVANMSSETTDASLGASTDASLDSICDKTTVRGRGCVTTQTGSEQCWSEWGVC